MAQARAQLELARYVDQPWCADDFAATDGAFAGPAKTSQDGQCVLPAHCPYPSARLIAWRSHGVQDQAAEEA
jgi:hypothetical protein